LIPRTRVNYTIWDIVVALVRRSRHGPWSRRLTGQLQDVYGIEPLLTASGRGALYHLLEAIPHHHVIVPAYTCSAVHEAAMLAGKHIRCVDVPAGCCNTTAEALTEDADGDSIIIATHQFGFPCDIKRVVAIAHAKGSYVVEDCAAALGATVDGQPVGTFGDASFFSFDCSKLVTVPLKGGFLVVQDSELRQRVVAASKKAMRVMSVLTKLRILTAGLVLRVIGHSSLYSLFHSLHFKMRGRVTAETGKLATKLNDFYCLHLAEWQACIASKQFSRLDALVSQRRILFDRLLDKLSAAQVTLPKFGDREGSAPIRFPILIPEDKIFFYHELCKRGIDCSFSFTFLAPHTIGPHAKEIAEQILDLPFYHSLTLNELDMTAKAVQGTAEKVST
jgi:dTDP-4-amino-4,6-dideoxygalactose transaminase